MTSSLNFQKPIYTYDLNGSVNGLDINEAIATFSPTLNKTVIGTVLSDMTISGSGLKKASLKRFLKGNGKFEIVDGEISSLNIGNQLKPILSKINIPATNKFLSREWGEKFKKLLGTFSISDGRFTNPTLVINYKGLSDSRLNGSGWIDFDTNLDYNAIFSVSSKDIDLGLTNNGREELPIHITGTLTAPKLDTGYTATRIAQTLAKNKAKNAALDLLKKNKHVNKVLENKKVEKVINNVGKKVFKKFGF